MVVSANSKTLSNKMKILKRPKTMFFLIIPHLCITAMLRIDKISQQMNRDQIKNELGFGISQSFFINNKTWTFEGFEPRASRSPPLLFSFLSFFSFSFSFSSYSLFVPAAQNFSSPPNKSRTPPEPSSSRVRVRLCLEAV